MQGNHQTHHQRDSRCNVCQGELSAVENERDPAGICPRCAAGAVSNSAVPKIHVLPLPPLPALHPKAKQPLAEPPVSLPSAPEPSPERVEAIAPKQPSGGPSSPFSMIPVAVPNKASASSSPAPYKDSGIHIGVMGRSSKATAPVFHRVASEPPSQAVEGSDEVGFELSDPNPMVPDPLKTRTKRHRSSGKRSRSARNLWAILMIMFLFLIVIAFVAVAIFIASGGGSYLGVEGATSGSRSFNS